MSVEEMGSVFRCFICCYQYFFVVHRSFISFTRYSSSFTLLE
jgi:hypothetical protein